ncbi:MAG: HEPN domain-containing protein [Chitinispirillaceae bacterium]|nr:HEPN domain-containing protein [Chitinispirillaceae bacterium]
MHDQKKVDYWHSLSEYDFETAKVMLEGSRYLYVGFMCHQAVEKALKAAHCRLVGTDPEYTHSLFRLAKNCTVYEQMPEQIIKTIDSLEPLNIETRYPTYREKLMKMMDKNRCQDLYYQTREVLSWLHGKYLK